MLVVVCYLLVAYLLIALLIYGLANMDRILSRRTYPRRYCIVRLLLPWMACVLLAAPLFPYLIVECRTARYKTLLIPVTREALAEIGASQDIQTFKVLKIGKQAATVYVITPCTAEDVTRKNTYEANTMELVRTSFGWRFRGSYYTVWSDCGSADGTIFPPYP